MARIKHGVFSWEDVLAQRYQNSHPKSLYPDTQQNQQHHQPLTIPTYTTQQHSTLLSKLPPELRLLVWAYVLGGHRIHIVQRSNRQMGHFVCRDYNGAQVKKSGSGATAGGCEVCQAGLAPRYSSKMGVKKRGEGLLALLLVCRQLYTESHNTLYTTNTLSIPSTWCLPYLLSTLPIPPPSPTPPLKSNIQIPPLTLTLHYAFPAHRLPSKDPVKHIYFSAGRAQWLRTCAAVTYLAASAGLREFRLILEGSWFAEGVERVPVFLEPLRGLHLSGSGSRCASRRNGEGGERQWEVILPKQPYYILAVKALNVELRERGFECLARV